MERCDERLRALLTPKEQDVLQAALDKLFDFALGELHGTPGLPLSAVRSVS